MHELDEGIAGGFASPAGAIAAEVSGDHLRVQSIDDALATIRSLGGEAVGEKIPVGEMGFAAYFKDTEGNVLGLWESASPS